MSVQTIRILIAGALLVHGIGHALGLWKPVRSGLFFTAPEQALRLAGGILWILVALGFIASSMSFYGILIPTNWWRSLAIVFSIISLVALLLFGRSWPVFNFVGASGLNIAILVALLWLDWPPFVMFNR